MHKDFLGNDITVGSFIVYAVRISNSAEMKMGKVVELSSAPVGYWSDKEIPIIKAVTITKRWGGGKLEVQKGGKPIKLTDLDRVMVIRDVPDSVREQLEQKENA